VKINSGAGKLDRWCQSLKRREPRREGWREERKGEIEKRRKSD